MASPLAQEIARLPYSEVLARIAALRALPPMKYGKLPPPKNPAEALSNIKQVNPSLGSQVETIVKHFEPRPPVQVKPVPWDKYKKYLPAPIVDHIKAEYDRKVDYVKRASDRSAAVELCNRAWLEQLTLIKQRAEGEVKIIEESIPRAEKIKALEARLPTITVEEFLDEYPEIRAKINHDIDNNVWNIEELPEEEEHHHH